MDLKSPWTLLLAWLLVPSLVAVASAGLGFALGWASGLRLGALTLPAGFLVGIVVMTSALELGLEGAPAVAIAGALALAGVLVFAFSARARAIALPIDRGSLWPAGCALAAFAIAMAPLVGSGRSGVVGYVLNNDPSVHLSAIELLREDGARAVDGGLSSYHAVATLFEDAYPLGSYPWVLLGSVFGGIEPFHLWTPLIALTSAMMALVGYALMRQIEAPRPFAAAAGALVACGYLPYSYLAQGGAKEVLTALTIYATVALFVKAVYERFDWRGLIPAAVAAAAAIHNLGLGALAWLGPAGAVAAAFLLWQTPGRRSRLQIATTLALAAGIALVVALPSALSSLDYVETSEEALLNPAQIGNLLGPVPWAEAFNIWLAFDYRFSEPDRDTLTAIGVLLAGLLAIAGTVEALRRRHYALLLTVVTGVAGAIIIASRYAIYFDAKAYMALAPALGLATAAGVLWLWRNPGRLRIGGVALGTLLAIGVLASDAYVYAGSWMTPKDRFQQMIDIGERFEGQGPMLVNEREEYAKYFLRDSRPWESWGSWQPDRGLRFPTVPAVPTTPDFDYYTSEHIGRFELLLERKRPGGSAPPGNFTPVHDTKHYRVWKRVGEDPEMHVALGLAGLDGRGRLDCRQQEVRRLLARAARRGGRVRVSYGGPAPVVSQPDDWDEYADWGPTPTKGFVSWRSGFAVAEPPLAPGRYRAFVQGSFGPGLRVHQDGEPIGETFADLGLQDGWQPIGTARVVRDRPSVVLTALERSDLRPGSRRFDIVGPLAFVSERPIRAIAELGAREARSLCGRRLDWIELL